MTCGFKERAVEAKILLLAAIAGLVNPIYTCKISTVRVFVEA